MKRFSLIFIVMVICLGPNMGQQIKDSLLKEFQEQNDTMQVISINEQSAKYRISEPDKAIRYNLIALELSQAAKYVNGEIKSNLLIGFTYHYHQVNDSAQFFILNALQIAKENDKTNSIAACHGSLANSFFQQNDYDTALEYYDLAIKDFEKLENDIGIAKCYLNMGTVFNEKGDNKAALESFFNSLRIAEEQNNIELISTNLNDIAIVYKEIGDNRAALKYLLMVPQIVNEDGKLLADVWNNIGMIYQDMGDLDSAEFYFMKGIDMCEKYSDIDGLAIGLNNIGVIYYDKEDWLKALDFFNRALKIAVEFNDDRNIAYYQNNISSVYIKTNRPEEAIETSSNSLERAMKINAIKEVRESHKILAEAYSMTGEFDQAYENMKLYNEYKDSIASENIQKEIQDLKARYELETKERELKIKNQKLEILTKDKELSDLRTIFYIVAIILVLIVGAVIIMYQRRQLTKNKLLREKEKELAEADMKNAELEKQNLLSEIEYKNQEITNFAIQIVEKNEFLEQLRSASKDLSKSPEASNLKSLISQNLNLEKDKEEFTAQVEQINEGFFLKLSEQFPKLTKNEKRLAALLRLDLSSKDISTLLNISPSSVDMNRHRLRKKIDLDAEVSLSDYFKNI